MMEFKTLLFEKQGPVGILTINQPETLNALNTSVLRELGQAFDKFAEDAELRVIVLTGAGRSFVAGADIAEMSGLDAEAGKVFGQLGASVFRKIELSEKIVIAAVNGYALGGGCELALACDIRIASEKAKFAQPETGLGIYTGRVIDAAEACRIGLVNSVTEPGMLLSEAVKMAEQIAARSPLAVQYAKEAINRGIETDIDTGIAIENGLFGLCFATEEQKQKMRAFLNK